MDCPPGQKKSGRFRRVVVVETWPALVEVRLYLIFNNWKSRSLKWKKGVT